MGKNPVAFFASMAYENLGIGYMRALLSKEGISSFLFDLDTPKSTLLRRLKKINPAIIGFSAIFQFNLDKIADLIRLLRSEGISCHFTAGGHYASLRSKELLKKIPKLDSIVRFEGEYTMLELAKCIYSGNNWKDIEGVAYLSNSKLIMNPIRKVENELDKFPFPARSTFRDFAFKKKYTTILAGRGCVHNCSFCNTKEYYRQMHGPVKRIRQPELVVKEMEYLHKRNNCSIFMFEDDDFPLMPKNEPYWIDKFCNSLHETGLDKTILWKINCRPDEVDEGSFRKMKTFGLFHVFLGIEDGTDNGLKSMNKHTTALINLNCVKIIKKLKIGFDYGFMLFQPESTFKSIESNLNFLTELCSDGYTPVAFQKLLPLYETKVEKDLLENGRLTGPIFNRDYDFREPALNRYYDFVMTNFSEWLTSSDGVTNISKWARDYLAVYSYYFNIIPDFHRFKYKIRKSISESNLYILNAMKELAIVFQSELKPENKFVLQKYEETIRLKHTYFRNQIIKTMAGFLQKVQFYSFFLQ